MASIEEILAAKKPIEQTINVLLDPDGNETADFTFRAVGRKAWRKLLEDYEPSDDQQAEAQKKQAEALVPERRREALWYDPDRFPPVALAVACADPEMTVEQATRLWESDRFSEGELIRMFSTVLQIHQTADRTMNWGKGSARTADSETNLPSAAPSGSPSTSSTTGPTDPEPPPSPTSDGSWDGEQLPAPAVG